MANFDKKIKQINGPINVARLEGRINGVKKVIYVFMDFHVDVSEQTECENIYSKDIQKYFVENFDRLNTQPKIYDFFLEIMPTRIQNIKYGYNFPIPHHYRDKYIGEVVKLFRKLFVFDPDKNKVSISTYFTKVRLHYMDIRDYFEKYYFDIFNKVFSVSSHMSCQNVIILNNLELIINIFNDFKTYLQELYNIIESYISSKNKPPNKKVIIKYEQVSERKPQTLEEQKISDFENLNYLLDKIYNKYTNKKIQTIIIDEIKKLNEQIMILIDVLQNTIIQYTKIRNTYQNSRDKLIKSPIDDYGWGLHSIVIRNMITFINNSIYEIYVQFVRTFALLMDLYFLRRFLDKNYITNAITYTGIAHSANYIDILVRKFDFKVTHTSYSKIPNMDELNSRIMDSKNIGDVEELFFPETLFQCSDMTHFPENFT